MKKNITIICPVYNEEVVIVDFFHSLKNYLANITEYNFSYIFVVDKGTDNTFELLKKETLKVKNVKIIHTIKRFGHQNCLIAGLDYTDLITDAIIMMDCDGQHPLKYIQKLLEKFENGYDVVNTKRINNKKISIFKYLFSNLFYKFIQFLSKSNLEEDSPDFRLISKKTIDFYKKNFSGKRIFLRGLFSSDNFKSTFVEFDLEERIRGKTKYSFIDLINFATNSIIVYTSRPLNLILSVSLAFCLITFCYSIYLIIAKLFFQIALPQGWPSLILILSFFISLNFICLAMIAKYINAIYREVKKDPIYIIEEIIENK